VVLGISMDEEGVARVQALPEKASHGLHRALGSEAISRQYGLGDLLPVTLIFDRSGKTIEALRRLYFGSGPASCRAAGFLKHQYSQPSTNHPAHRADQRAGEKPIDR